ncbi:MAG: RimK family alpha-L-glutamate ligase [Candidatus Helarchaeota archaeon]|nr:RimK family alpha-L-glutamate ligase [Candidatus Helarchaeota archaeon]
MKIVVLSRKKTFYSTKMIITTAKQKGHEVIFVDPMKCNVVLGKKGLAVYYKNRKMTKVNLVLTRIGVTFTDYGLSVVRQFEIMGSKVINISRGIHKSKDKMRCLQLLAMQKIPVPRTVITREPKNLVNAVKIVGGVPVILKPLYGSQGMGVILAESIKAVESIIGTLWDLEQNILIQQYVSESKGKDIRAFVVGGQVLASMRRVAKADEFRSNIHRGGTGEKVELSEDIKKIAVNAAKVMELEIAGVDILETSNGPLVMEVNSSPGFEELEKVTGINIAEKIVDYAVSSVEKHLYE